MRLVPERRSPEASGRREAQAVNKAASLEREWSHLLCTSQRAVFAIAELQTLEQGARL